MEPGGGKVYIVGAGPGNPEYLTVRGQRCLQQAEVLVYDALVSEEMLSWLPLGCDRIYVGKRGGQPSPEQAQINQILVEQCQRGQQVVRLKSGDPLIFGRTTAEIQALREAGCAYELVPGVSSALAGPLLAGIPLTDPVFSPGFAVVTGHDLEALDWDALARIKTLVILMGTRTLAEICQQLLRQGLRSEMPIAIIRWASQPQQQVWQGTLLNILQITKGQPLSPSVVVIGEVVGLRPYLQPEENSPESSPVSGPIDSPIDQPE